MLWYLLYVVGGVGKSVMSTLFHKKFSQEFIAYHYCVYNSGPEFRDPRVIVRSLVDQLYINCKAYKDKFTDQKLKELAALLSNSHFNTVELWNNFVVEPLQALDRDQVYPAGGRCYAILIDALDESGSPTDPDNNDLLLILDKFVDKLPSWFKILVTSRPEKHIIARIEAKAYSCVVSTTDKKNEEDVRRYISATIKPFTNPAEHERATDAICLKVQGLFLSARMMLSEHGILFRRVKLHF